jgi:hypothetical protein
MMTTSQMTIQSTFITNDSISDKFKQAREKGEEEVEMKGSE